MPRKVFNPEELSFERMPGEPPKAFQAFRMYRDMGPNRTLNNVRISMGKHEGYQSMLEVFSTKYEWVERAGMFDAEQDRMQRKQSERSVAFWEHQRQQSLMENLKLSRQLRDKLYAMIDHPLTKEIIKDIGGKQVTMIVPAKWTFSTVATLSKVMAELEAATIGEALQGAVDEGFDPDTATIEELRDYVNKTRSKKA